METDDPPTPKRRKGSNMTQRTYPSSKAGAFMYPRHGRKAYAYERILQKHPEVQDMLGARIRAILIEGA